MPSPQEVREALTLEKFLQISDIDVAPYQEFINGRIEVKVSPKFKHGVIEGRLVTYLNQFCEADGQGMALPELRCTFAGRSIVPDVAFLTDDHIATDERGEYIDDVFIPPDLHVEIVSPDRHEKKNREKLTHSTANGCLLGWLIHPHRKTIDVSRPGRPPERLPADGVMEGEPVLPGLRLPVAEVFGWLVHRRPGGAG